MDSIFLVLALERLVGFLGVASSKSQQDKFDIIVYDGVSSEETLRVIGGSSKARFWNCYFLSHRHEHPRHFLWLDTLIL
jgi:arsenite-transporting ATPase